MRVTIALGVGSHMTSLPGWRNLGSYNASPYRGKSCAARTPEAPSAISAASNGRSKRDLQRVDCFSDTPAMSKEVG
jgi:hypothetical protein